MLRTAPACLVAWGLVVATVSLFCSEAFACVPAVDCSGSGNMSTHSLATFLALGTDSIFEPTVVASPISHPPSSGLDRRTRPVLSLQVRQS